jgi:site-specific recombinase XerD
MLERCGDTTRQTQLVQEGPLALLTDAFGALLEQEGYAPQTVREKLRLHDDLSRWLERRKLHAADLDEQQLRLFLRSRARRHCTRRGDAATCRQLVGFLRRLGGISAAVEEIDPSADTSALECIEQDFARFLSSERGLKPVTVTAYLRTVRCFLLQCFGQDEIRLDTLRLQDVNRFILDRVRHVRRGYAKLIVTALRSFLRYLQQRSTIAADIAAGVPSVANWRLSHLPKALTPAQVERLLTCCDRNTPMGQRDYAILLLLARLGLRAGEIVAMTLDDVDWHAGEFIVRGKGDRLERLPLPRDVGAALAHYLRYVRPRCSSRRVFIRLKAPLGGFSGAAAICDVVRRALRRAELDPDFKGAHLLRHSLATNMLRRGASLEQIGQLLRHDQANTTQIYAKVDIEALRGIALPWPGDAA